MFGRLVTIAKPRLQHQTLLKRCLTTTATGAILPFPERTSFGLIRACLVVIPGLFIGSMISMHMANILEETELFVRSDEDDDDD